MFRFEDPIYLYLLLLIPLLAVIYFAGYRRRRKRLRKFGDPQLLRQLMPDVSRWRPGVKFWLLQAALALLIIMLARPHGYPYQPREAYRHRDYHRYGHLELHACRGRCPQPSGPF